MENETYLTELLKSNEVLRSCYQVIQRRGESTNWSALEL